VSVDEAQEKNLLMDPKVFAKRNGVGHTPFVLSAAGQQQTRD
jgi:hypothetical protein